MLTANFSLTTFCIVLNFRGSGKNERSSPCDFVAVAGNDTDYGLYYSYLHLFEPLAIRSDHGSI